MQDDYCTTFLIKAQNSLPQKVYVHWLKINFSQLCVAWIHLKALRVFVESALRSGLRKALKLVQRYYHSLVFFVRILLQVWITGEVSSPPAPNRQEAIQEAGGRARFPVRASGPHCHDQQGGGLFEL